MRRTMIRFGLIVLLCAPVIGGVIVKADEAQVVTPQAMTPCDSAAACHAWADNGWCEAYLGYIYTEGISCVRVCRTSSFYNFFFKKKIVSIDAACY